MKRILVTGAGGQLGKTLQEVSYEYPEIEFVFKSRESLDITDSEALSKAVSEQGFTHCINCAAYTNVAGAEKEVDSAFLINAFGAKNLAIACAEANTTLIHISTDYVFDGEKNEAYTPLDTPNPINEYGKSKLAGENLIKNNTKKYFIIRTSWLYSKIHGKNFYKTILTKAGQTDTLYVTNEERGCPTNTISLSKFLIEKVVLGSLAWGTYHFCDTEPMTWFEFAKKILEENNIETKLEKRVAPTNSKLRRPKNSALSN